MFNKALFFYQFAALTKAGFSGAKSLPMAGAKAPVAVRQFLYRVSQRMDRGTSLAIALNASKSPFTPWEMGLLVLGETSGALSEVSQRLGQLHETYRRRARLYGSVVIGFGAIAAVVVTVLSTWLVGGLSALNSVWGLGLVSVLVLAILFQTQVPLTLEIGDRGHHWLEQFPITANIIEARSLVQLSELSLPIRCGLPLPRALELAQPRISDPQLRALMQSAVKRIDRGDCLSDCLKTALPPTAVQMIRTGEETGHLDTLLDKLGKHYDHELEHRLRRLEAMSRPLAMLAVGCLILLVGTQLFTGLLSAVFS